MVKKCINKKFTWCQLDLINWLHINWKYSLLFWSPAIDPETGSLVTDTINGETHQVMKNISEVLKVDMDFIML